MGTANVSAGPNLPEEFHTVIEIPMHGQPVKYEVDKATDAVFVDRILFTSMRYPCNYGYIPQTLAEDGDPLDVLLLAPVPLITGSVVRSRPVGVFNMIDEHGQDTKILAVPMDAVCNLYSQVKDFNDVPVPMRDQIRHFFDHYKDLEPGKRVETGSWDSHDQACREIMVAYERYSRESGSH